MLDVLVQKRRSAAAAMKLLRRLLKAQGIFPETITTDKPASYRAALRRLGILDKHRAGGMRQNNRAENSHLPLRRRERKQQRYNSQGSAQRFLSSHGPIYNCLASPPFGSTLNPPDFPPRTANPARSRSPGMGSCDAKRLKIGRGQAALGGAPNNLTSPVICIELLEVRKI